jgi:hypothetical protein
MYLSPAWQRRGCLVLVVCAYCGLCKPTGCAWRGLLHERIHRLACSAYAPHLLCCPVLPRRSVSTVPARGDRVAAMRMRFWRFCGQDGREESPGYDHTQIRHSCSVASKVAEADRPGVADGRGSGERCHCCLRDSVHQIATGLCLGQSPWSAACAECE